MKSKKFQLIYYVKQNNFFYLIFKVVWAEKLVLLVNTIIYSILCLQYFKLHRVKTIFCFMNTTKNP